MWRIAVPAQTSAAMARIAFTHISTAPFIFQTKHRFMVREICAQQSDQPCCICTAEVPASAVLLFASLHLLHLSFPLAAA